MEPSEGSARVGPRPWHQRSRAGDAPSTRPRRPVRSVDGVVARVGISLQVAPEVPEENPRPDTDAIVRAILDEGVA